MVCYQKNVDINVEWVGRNKQRLPQNKYKMLYYFFRLRMFTPEVWCLIFSYLTYNDLIEVSACSKVFYYLSKLNEIKDLSKNCLTRGLFFLARLCLIITKMFVCRLLLNYLMR